MEKNKAEADTNDVKVSSLSDEDTKENTKIDAKQSIRHLEHAYFIAHTIDPDVRQLEIEQIYDQKALLNSFRKPINLGSDASCLQKLPKFEVLENIEYGEKSLYKAKTSDKSEWIL